MKDRKTPYDDLNERVATLEAFVSVLAVLGLVAFLYALWKVFERVI